MISNTKLRYNTEYSHVQLLRFQYFAIVLYLFVKIFLITIYIILQICLIKIYENQFTEYAHFLINNACVPLKKYGSWMNKEGQNSQDAKVIPHAIYENIRYVHEFPCLKVVVEKVCENIHSVVTNDNINYIFLPRF